MQNKHEIEQGKKIKDSAEVVWRWDSPTGIVRSHRRANFFVHLGLMNYHTNALEIGCGTGLFTKLVYEKSNANITAIDISQELIDVAISKSINASFQKMDALYLNYDDQTFDVVFGSSILHHLPEKAALTEVFRVLKPGGKIIFAEPNMLNPHIFFQKNVPAFKKYWGDCPDESAIVRWKLKKILNKVGFTKSFVTPYDYLYPLTPVFLIKTISFVGNILEKLPLIKEIAGSVIIYAERPR
jgi:ubiquinone/menaquinone biosynthesis C-methylase UbiE